MNGFNASVLALGAALMASPVLADGHGNGQGGGMMAEFVTEWDMNGDGMVTIEDLATRRGDLFAMFDLNGDGNIDAEEQANMADTIAMQQEANHGGGNGQGNAHGRRGPGPLIHGAMTAEYADTNHDGVISQAEWEAATPRLFAQLDRNGDGHLDAQDFRHNG